MGMSEAVTAWGLRQSGFRRQRDRLKGTLATNQEEVVGISVEILQRMISSAIPEASKLRFEARHEREHWTGSQLTLVSITDRQGNEIAWQELLPPDDLDLLKGLQQDLTECYAIPKERVSLTLPVP
jgi:hypothetical protein